MIAGEPLELKEEDILREAEEEMLAAGGKPLSPPGLAGWLVRMGFGLNAVDRRVALKFAARWVRLRTKWRWGSGEIARLRAQVEKLEKLLAVPAAAPEVPE